MTWRDILVHLEHNPQNLDKDIVVLDSRNDEFVFNANVISGSPKDHPDLDEGDIFIQI